MKTKKKPNRLNATNGLPIRKITSKQDPIQSATKRGGILQTLKKTDSPRIKGKHKKVPSKIRKYVINRNMRRSQLLDLLAG